MTDSFVNSATRYSLTTPHALMGSSIIDLMQFYWMDYGVYGRDNGGNPGLYSTAWREVGLSFFAWGAHRVVKG
jgi:hypothetical protein